MGHTHIWFHDDSEASRKAWATRKAGGGKSAAKPGGGTSRQPVHRGAYGPETVSGVYTTRSTPSKAEEKRLYGTAGQGGYRRSKPPSEAKKTYRERSKELATSPGGGRETASLKTTRVMRELRQIAESLGPHEALQDFGERYGKNHARAVGRTMEALGPEAGFKHMREIVHKQHGGGE